MSEIAPRRGKVYLFNPTVTPIDVSVNIEGGIRAKYHRLEATSSKNAWKAQTSKNAVLRSGDDDPKIDTFSYGQNDVYIYPQMARKATPLQVTISREFQSVLDFQLYFFMHPNDRFGYALLHMGVMLSHDFE